MLIDLPPLLSKYEIDVKGVLHVGAHLAEEAELYKNLGFEKVIWVEGNPNLISALKERLLPFPNQEVYQVLVNDEDGKETELHLTNDLQASSILPFGKIDKFHPSIKKTGSVKVISERLDTFIRREKIDVANLNFLNIDIQGAEFKALISLGGLLKNFNAICLEVNIVEIYKGVPLIEKIDELLLENGFLRVTQKITQYGWGDAFYVKKEINLFNIIRSKGSLWKLRSIFYVSDKISGIKNLIKQLIRP